MRSMGKSTGGGHAALLLVALLVLGITWLPAGVGTHGRQGQVAGGSEVRYTINGQTFRLVLTSGQTMASVQTAMITKINTESGGSLVATAVSDPEDPNNNSIEVTLAGGGEVTQFSVCENDATFNNTGVKVGMGKGVSILGKPAVVNANGNYRLRINMWDSADYDVTFLTTDANKDTPAELLAAITASLTAAGFTVQDLGTSCGSFGSSIGAAGCINISKTGEMIVSTRIEATDTGLKEFCMSQEPTSSGIPTVSQYGMFALVLLLTISAIVMMRRRRTMTT